MVTVSSSDLESLLTEDLRKLQFYSGEIDIIFQAHTDEITRKVRREALITTNRLTEYTRTIPKKTPGTLVRIDHISREIYLRFDPDLPTLLYRDLGSGMELATYEFVLDRLTYARVLEFPRGNRGQLNSQDRRFLAIKKTADTERKKDRRKAVGVRTTQ